MCPIIWSSFSWEAFATLFTGVAAVGGAVWIWMRQQLILDRQVELEELKLRSDLFDRRFVVYEDTRRWFGKFLREGQEPYLEDSLEFYAAIDRAGFLFRPNVAETLEGYRKLATQHTVCRKENRYQDAADIFLEMTSALTNLKLLFAEMHMSPLAEATEFKRLNRSAKSFKVQGA